MTTDVIEYNMVFRIRILKTKIGTTLVVPLFVTSPNKVTNIRTTVCVEAQVYFVSLSIKIGTTLVDIFFVTMRSILTSPKRTFGCVEAQVYFVGRCTTELEDTVRSTNDDSARSTDKRTEVEEDEDSRKQSNKEFYFLVVDVILGHDDKY